MANGGIIGPVNTITPGGPGTAETITRVTASGSHTMQPTTSKATITMVSGGAGGGSAPAEAGAGGGAGGVLKQQCITVSGGVAYPITIGGGGAGFSGAGNNGGCGVATSMPTIPGTTAAAVGGYGASGHPYQSPGFGGNGGSGGGSSGKANQAPQATSAGTLGQGFPGGSSSVGWGPAQGNNSGAGGGGAGQAGQMNGPYVEAISTTLVPQDQVVDLVVMV